MPDEIISNEVGEDVQEQDSNVQEETHQETQGTQGQPAEQQNPEVEKQKTRPTWTMPVEKAQEEKRRAVEKAREEARLEAEERIQKLQKEYEEKLSSGKPVDDYRKKLEGVASKYNLDPTAAAELLSVMEENIKSSLPDLSKYDKIVQEREQEAHKIEASKEFDAKVLPIIQKDFPNVTPQHIQEVREKVIELAFSEGYNTYRIEDIYKVKSQDFEFKNGFSAEPSGGRTSELTDFSRMTDEEEHALAERDPAAFKRYLKAMEKNGSIYQD